MNVMTFPVKACYNRFNELDGIAVADVDISKTNGMISNLHVIPTSDVYQCQENLPSALAKSHGVAPCKLVSRNNSLRLAIYGAKLMCLRDDNDYVLKEPTTRCSEIFISEKATLIVSKTGEYQIVPTKSEGRASYFGVSRWVADVKARIPKAQIDEQLIKNAETRSFMMGTLALPEGTDWYKDKSDMNLEQFTCASYMHNVTLSGSYNRIVAPKQCESFSIDRDIHLTNIMLPRSISHLSGHALTGLRLHLVASQPVLDLSCYQELDSFYLYLSGSVETLILPSAYVGKVDCWGCVNLSVIKVLTKTNGRLKDVNLQGRYEITLSPRVKNVEICGDMKVSIEDNVRYYATYTPATIEVSGNMDLEISTPERTISLNIADGSVISALDIDAGHSMVKYSPQTVKMPKNYKRK